jgi:hypothetical protein
MYNDTNWFLIIVAIGVAIILWLVISFITMDLSWPVRTGVGRFSAVLLSILLIKTYLESK